MQPKARMRQHLLHLAAVKILQALAKLLADKISCRAFLAGQQLVMLANVVMLQPLKTGHRLIQAGCGHTPRADGRAN